MSTVMEFWGVEVKSGQPHKVNPGDSRVVHLSQASLGEIKKDKGIENVCLYLKVNDKKLVIGTLSPEKFPQLSFDLVLEKDFELSHNWKNGSVYFTGYKVRMEQGTVSEDDDSDEDEDGMEIIHGNNGKPELPAKSVSEKASAIKPDASTAKQNVKDVKPNQKADYSDSDDSDSKASSTDDDETSEVPNPIKNQSDESSGELDESDEDDDESNHESESDDEDEQTPKKAEPNRKRPAEAGTKTPVPDKRTKFVTPQKTEGKKGIIHTATPHPSKKTAKTPANSNQSKQAQKSGGSYPCKSCNRSFTTEGGLQAHTKAKHSAAA